MFSSVKRELYKILRYLWTSKYELSTYPDIDRLLFKHMILKILLMLLF